MTELETVNLNYATENKKILSAISLSIKSNSTYALIGPSGSGKSTLLQMFNRMLDPSSGQVFYKNQNLLDLDVIRLRKEVGMVFQNPYLFPGTVKENLAFGPTLSGLKFSDYEGEYYLSLVGINRSYLDTSIENLSGGQKQRIALARTLANKPRVLLLDEPTSALDPSSTELIEKSIAEIKTSLGLTIVWVTHNMEQAQRMSDYTVLLYNGQVLEFNETTKIFSCPRNQTTASFINGRLKEEL